MQTFVPRTFGRAQSIPSGRGSAKLYMQKSKAQPKTQKNNVLFKIFNLSSGGQSLIEFIVAVAIFLVIATSTTVAVLGSFSSTRLSEEGSRAVFLAEEGEEAVKSMKNRDWALLTNAAHMDPHGLSSTAGTWSFSGASDVSGKYTRSVTITSVNRNNGAIVTSGGVTDPDTKRIDISVSWNFSPTRTNSITFTSYVTRWQEAHAKGGPTSSCITGASDCLFLNTSNSNLAASNREIRGMTLENTDSTNAITIDRMVVAWTGVAGTIRMQDIRINGTTVWSGSVSSGTEVDITNVALAPGASSIDINRVRFSSGMGAAVFSITFIMSDTTQKTLSEIEP